MKAAPKVPKVYRFYGGSIVDKLKRENAMLREALVNSKEHAAVVRRALTWYRLKPYPDVKTYTRVVKSLAKACAALLKARAPKGERK